MKTRRLKKATRVLSFFRFNYGYDPPYSILLDGTFCQAALQNKINLREQMPKYLGDQSEMFVTSCVLNELEQLGKAVYGALFICRQFRVAKCPHKPLRIASECIAHLARRSQSKDKDRKRYLIGTQDDQLLNKLRTFSGIPLISIRGKTLFLERPSTESKAGIENKNETIELERAKEMKASVFGEPEPVRKRKKLKGPNPLSCKKKKKKNATNAKPCGGIPGAFGRQAKNDAHNHNRIDDAEKDNRHNHINSEIRSTRRRR